MPSPSLDVPSPRVLPILVASLLCYIWGTLLLLPTVAVVIPMTGTALTALHHVSAPDKRMKRSARSDREAKDSPSLPAGAPGRNAGA